MTNQEIARLNKLTVLRVSKDKMVDFPKMVEHLHNLTSLDLRGNQISHIPPEFAQLNKLTELYFSGNLFEIGFEVYELPPSKQIQEILKWQKAKKDKILRPIHEAKVIFIGESNYGKTHLIEYLLKGKIDRKITTTHGIERRSIKIPYNDSKIKLNIWDLGGQEFMRSTHQFFFSERTIYVVVTLARRERNELNHWLELANKLGKKAPVLIAINKIDENPHDLNHSSLKEDYPNIAGIVRTCIKDCDEKKADDAIVELKNQIIDIATNKNLMPSIFESRRPEWFIVKEALEKIESNGEDFISYKEYESLEHIQSLPPEERKDNLRLLSILGTVVSFVDDPRMIDTNVINPQWILDGVYSIINDPVIKDENKGRFHFSELQRLFKNEPRFPIERHQYLIQLLEKFNLCYSTSGQEDCYYIPDLFNDNEPPFSWDKEEAMRFRYNYYDFPPESFMTRCIVEMHEDIHEDIRWRKGVLLSNGSCQAKVYQTFKDNYINIEIAGSKTERRLYLYSICQVFRKLHKPFDMKIRQEVFYKGEWLDYLNLVKFEDKNKPYYHPDLDEDLPVTEILNGYSSRSDRNITNESLLEQIITACQRLQGKSKMLDTAHSREDNRNEFVAELLDQPGLKAQGQALWGVSGSKIQAGEVDIKFEDRHGRPLGIFEGFNIRYDDKTAIHSHLGKVFNYDPNGLVENFVVVYSDAPPDKFVALWDKYQKTASKAPYSYKMKGVFSDLTDRHSPGAELMVGRTRHQRNDRVVNLYHLFVNMNVK